MELLLLFLENFFILTILNGIINLNCNNLGNKLVILSPCLPPNMHTELYLPPSHLASNKPNLCSSAVTLTDHHFNDHMKDLLKSSNQVTRLSRLMSAGEKKQFQWTGSSLPTLIRSNHSCYLSLYTVDDRKRSLIFPPLQPRFRHQVPPPTLHPPSYKIWSAGQPTATLHLRSGGSSVATLPERTENEMNWCIN